MYTNLLCVSVYFLSIQHLQYQHILLTRNERYRVHLQTGEKIKLSTEGAFHLRGFGE